MSLARFTKILVALKIKTLLVWYEYILTYTQKQKYVRYFCKMYGAMVLGFVIMYAKERKVVKEKMSRRRHRMTTRKNRF